MVKTPSVGERSWTVIKIAGRAVGWILAAVGLAATLGGAVFNLDWLKSHVLLTIGLVAAGTVFLTLIYVIYELVTNGIVDRGVAEVPHEVQELVTLLYRNERYVDVVRLGSGVGRYLWLGQHYDERLAVGEMVEDSASKEDRHEEQVQALIDDLGWTLVTVGRTKKAEDQILSGIGKALEYELFYYAAKGERHLAGLKSKIGAKGEILAHLDKSQEYSDQIEDASQRKQMEASLLLARAEYFFESEDYVAAERAATQAEKLFSYDKDRVVKVYSLLGNIYLAQGRTHLQRAKDAFNQGYHKSKTLRRDEYAKNLYGLGRVALQENNVLAARRYLSEARDGFDSQHNTAEVQEIDDLLRGLSIEE